MGRSRGRPPAAERKTTTQIRASQKTARMLSALARLTKTPTADLLDEIAQAEIERRYAAACPPADPAGIWPAGFEPGES